MNATASQFIVGMADIYSAKGPALYTCLGLGSCIGLAFLDPSSQVSGMIHIMLPEKFPNRPVDKVGKFADTGIQELLGQLEKLGVNKRSLKLAYAGGAQVFKFGSPSADSKLDVGRRNAEAVETILRGFGMTPVAKDVGGSVGRTVHFCSVTGQFRVRSINAGEKVLCTLR